MAKVKLVIPLLSQFWVCLSGGCIRINPRYFAQLIAGGYSSLMELRILPIFADPGDARDLQLPDEPSRYKRAKGQLLWNVPVPEEAM